MVAAPTPPYIPANLTGGYQGTINRIVMHGTVAPGTYCGAAQDLGEYFRDLLAPPAGRWASCHYGTDPCEDRQYVYDNTVAYHAPPNEGSIGIEMCDPQQGPDSRWDDAEHEAMLDRAAALTRQLCLAYDVPMVWLMADDLRAGKRGITDHENVSLAWGQTHHTDPGWSTERSDDFMRRVRAVQPEEDDMPSAEEIARAVWEHKFPNAGGDGVPVKMQQLLSDAEFYGYQVNADRYATPWGSEDNPTWTFKHAIESLWRQSWRTEQQAAGLAKAVEALSDDSTLTAERVEQIVREAVAQNIEITGNVEITGQEPQG